MEIATLPIEGAVVVTPRVFADPRGAFYESFRGDRLAEVLGHRMDVVQTNVSISARGTIRGVHFADVPPGQAKYVTVLAGAILDVVVDLRTGSPTFGRAEEVRLDTTTRRALYLAEGLGHAFCALEDRTTVAYLCSTAYAPEREHTIHPLDPELALPWPVQTPVLSERDAAAPSLAEARERGILPDYAVCRAYAAELAARSR